MFTDDMLIVAGFEAFAGPASVDLRDDAAERLGGTSLGVVGSRTRWRKMLTRPAVAAPLGGWVELVWSDGPCASPGSRRESAWRSSIST